MSYPRLAAETAGKLPPGVRRPGYERSQLRPGILHLGAGAFHRCHQAEWTDDALESAFGDWGIVAVNLREPDLAPLLGVQDGLFCRELRDGEVRQQRLVGSIIRTEQVHDARRDPERRSLARALAQAASAEIRALTLTITEKGYCHVPATGALNLDHPDIVHDIAHPDAPVSAPGFVLRALAIRIDRGTALPAILSCDNVPDNSATLRRAVLGLAQRTASEIASRIEREARFLNTMVDRIVPATRDTDIDAFAAETGIRDTALVVGEPFRMWVIENRDGAVLPPWQAAGAIVVDDVAPFEIMKMRVLNGIQTSVSALGLIGGVGFMSEVMERAPFREFARRTMLREVLPGLPPVPGIDLQSYVEQSITRLRNPALRHGTAQITTDGSQKLRQRLLEPIRACLRLGVPADGLLLGVAGWMQAATGTTLAGQRHSATDPLSGRTQAVAEAAGGDTRALVRGLLAIGEVFGDDLRHTATLEDGIVDRLTAMRTGSVDSTLDAFLRT
jgi:fructuronate reductase